MDSPVRFGALLTLFAGFAFLHFAARIRSVLGSAAATIDQIASARKATRAVATTAGGSVGAETDS